MRRLLFIAPVLCLSIPVLLAADPAVSQPSTGTIDTSWKCSVPESVSALPVPGQADHAYSIYTIKCLAGKGQIAGIRQREGSATEFADASGSTSRGHGVFVETLANDDTITYGYEFTATLQNQLLQEGKNSWKIEGGSGTLKGITGSGTCRARGSADGLTTFDCAGSYAIGRESAR